MLDKMSTLEVNMRCQRRNMYAYLGNQINWRNNMKSLLYSSVLAFSVMGAAPAFAQDDPTSPTGGPVMLSAAEMDTARGGALLTVFAVDVVDVNNNNIGVNVPVNAAVGANVLCSTCTANPTADQRPGNFTQRQ
jgi:hypothetical protein